MAKTKSGPPQGSIPIGKGRCQWCLREDVDLVETTVGSRVCPEMKECFRARSHRLIVNRLRPRSWYERLAKGGAEELRECRAARVDIEQLLSELEVDKETAKRYNETVGLPPEVALEGETEDE